MQRRATQHLIWPIVGICLIMAACGSPQTQDDNSAPPDGSEAKSDASPPPSEEEKNTAGTYDEVVAAVEGLEGQERTDALLSLAEDEGSQLLWYTAMRLDLAEKMKEAFGTEYGIDVEVYRADKDTVLLRVMEESAANYE